MCCRFIFMFVSSAMPFDSHLVYNASLFVSHLDVQCIATGFTADVESIAVAPTCVFLGIAVRFTLHPHLELGPHWPHTLANTCQAQSCSYTAGSSVRTHMLGINLRSPYAGQIAGGILLAGSTQPSLRAEVPAQLFPAAFQPNTK